MVERPYLGRKHGKAKPHLFAGKQGGNHGPTIFVGSLSQRPRDSAQGTTSWRFYHLPVVQYGNVDFWEIPMIQIAATLFLITHVFNENYFGVLYLVEWMQETGLIVHDPEVKIYLLICKMKMAGTMCPNLPGLVLGLQLSNHPRPEFCCCCCCCFNLEGEECFFRMAETPPSCIIKLDTGLFEHHSKWS